MEKRESLRRVELSFSDGKINPKAYFIYDIDIYDNGIPVSKTIHRAIKSLAEVNELLSQVLINK